MSVFKLEPIFFPKRADWVLVDMNVKPTLAVAALKRVMVNLKVPPKGVLMTLKLSHDLAVSHLDICRKLIREMGLKKVAIKQLFHSHQEVALWASE